MGSREPPIIGMLANFLRNAFYELSEFEQRRFFAFVGERDCRLSDPRAEKAPFCVKEEAYKGK